MIRLSINLVMVGVVIGLHSFGCKKSKEGADTDSVPKYAMSDKGDMLFLVEDCPSTWIEGEGCQTKIEDRKEKGYCVLLQEKSKNPKLLTDKGGVNDSQLRDIVKSVGWKLPLLPIRFVGVADHYLRRKHAEKLKSKKQMFRVSNTKMAIMIVRISEIQPKFVNSCDYILSQPIIHNQ